MSSPQRHLSVDELTQRASTGLAIRRGDLKISDPIPSSYVHNGAEMDGVYEQPTPRMEGATGWPRKNGADTVGKTEDTPQPFHVSRFTERTSLGPSLAASNMSSTPSKDSLQRRNTGGLRATIKRMFSKKEKNTTLQKRSASQGVSILLETYVSILTLATGSQQSPFYGWSRVSTSILSTFQPYVAKQGTTLPCTITTSSRRICRRRATAG